VKSGGGGCLKVRQMWGGLARKHTRLILDGLANYYKDIHAGSTAFSWRPYILKEGHPSGVAKGRLLTGVWVEQNLLLIPRALRSYCKEGASVLRTPSEKTNRGAWTSAPAEKTLRSQGQSERGRSTRTKKKSAPTANRRS